MENTNPVDQIPIWDEADALKRVMGQEAILKLLVDAYFKDIPDYMEQLADHINNQDLAGASKCAHAIKGATGNLSAFALSNKAKVIESLCHGEALLSSVQTEYDELLDILELTNSALADWQKIHA